MQLRSRTELDHPDVAGKAVVDLELQGSRSRWISLSMNDREPSSIVEPMAPPVTTIFAAISCFYKRLLTAGKESGPKRMWREMDSCSSTVGWPHLQPVECWYRSSSGSSDPASLRLSRGRWFFFQRGPCWGFAALIVPFGARPAAGSPRGLSRAARLSTCRWRCRSSGDGLRGRVFQAHVVGEDCSSFPPIEHPSSPS